MTGNTVHAAEAAYRKKRVKRIKKIIVGTAIVLLLQEKRTLRRRKYISGL